MKISELESADFLGNNDIAENSYLLINYAPDENTDPITQTVSLKELGQAITANQGLLHYSTARKGFSFLVAEPSSMQGGGKYLEPSVESVSYPLSLLDAITDERTGDVYFKCYCAQTNDGLKLCYIEDSVAHMFDYPIAGYHIRNDGMLEFMDVVNDLPIGYIAASESAPSESEPSESIP